MNCVLEKLRKNVWWCGRHIDGNCAKKYIEWEDSNLGEIGATIEKINKPGVDTKSKVMERD